jgi:DNA-binding transcriptional MerR regulator
MEQPLRVGQLARATGVRTKTIRYYEQVGVLPFAPRSAAGYRQYFRHDVDRLLFVRPDRALGLPLARLRDLMAELEGGRCMTMRPRLQRLVTEQLRATQQQIADFQALERQLMELLQRLEVAVPRSDASGCRCLAGMSHN